MSYGKFIEKWTSADYGPKPVAGEELEAAETALDFKLPASFKTALAQHGAASTNIDLLDAIVDQNLDLADVHDFLTPEDIVGVTQDWRPLGLPGDAVAFATDCCGNLFCFRADSGDAVWLWDHDFKHIEQVAAGFNDWLAPYCAITGDEGGLSCPARPPAETEE